MRPLLAIENLTVSFDETRVLHGVDFSIGKGEALGLVGESGSGKSVTWLAALGLLPRSAKVAGRVLLDGQNILGAPEGALDHVRGRRVAMIFQDPASALNPVLTIRRQLSETLALHRGLSGRSLQAECKRLLDLVGIPDAERRLSAYPHEFSGGQNQRIMIAMALSGNPDLLIADEPTTALDVTIQAQILELLGRVRRETGMAMVLISHDLGVVSENCDRVAVMYAGRVVEKARAGELFDDPCHPYSNGLIGALPPLDGERRRLTAIGGTVPDPRNMPAGCAFAPRCALETAACKAVPPLLVPVGPGRDVACHVVAAQRQMHVGQAAE
ncbi:ABC transporter ATP-binding protein [Bradyrhizobium sp. LHD-71]|uniref:ABC transporter ATP-binding protein n=1 Tax=Bradyrhizobium sp. LHD-71 TaxID=3072141 RepID=UPI00280DE4D8|nr:ABC transporter ATP-binding protein [Bradyrhizobium sp. LHD-71]MDQ8732265.1 ABC transporter ATP-binding protein [Bradyrhizobium sp. LHD-71]